MGTKDMNKSSTSGEDGHTCLRPKLPKWELMDAEGSELLVHRLCELHRLAVADWG
jgi:hypothetical protein